MENKLNLVEILKDCPKGMELDCRMYEDVVFYDIVDRYYPIRVRRKQGGLINLNAYGCINDKIDSKCIIFPKGKTTWEGFHRPFKDGDIVAGDVGWIGITKGGKINSFIPTYCVVKPNDEFEAYFVEKETWQFSRLATEEEKQKLFQAIKDNGYKWNPETKTLEKLVEPKFKVGDKIKSKVLKSDINTITKVCENHYELDDGFTLELDCQDKWRLVSDKFDLTTLVPFESRVLVRAADNQFWRPAIWGVKHEDWDFCCVTGGEMWEQCIPYEGNEHLLGTTDDCDNFYKTWTES